MDTAGFAIAFIAMVLFGLYMVPRKLSHLTDVSFVLTMSIGTLATTHAARLIRFGIHPPALAPEGVWLSCSCGPLWTMGILFFALSVSRMGLALATPIKNTTAVLGTLIGLIGFAEWRHTQPILAVIGSLLVVATAALLARCGEEKRQRSAITLSGVLFAVLAAVMFASYTVPLKLAQAHRIDSYSIIAFMSLGTLGTAAVTFAALERNWRRWLAQPFKEHALAAIAGIIWATATILMTEAIGRIGLAITWPIANLNTIPAVAVGTIAFGEIDLRKYGPLIAFAILCAIVGSALLGIARA